jgi:hypothetical protein
MSQNALAPINPATTSGTDLATKLVNNEDSVLTQYSGTSRPSYAQNGTLWLDTTTNPWLWKIYNGTIDIVIAAFSTGASGREREGVAEASISSAATTNVTGSTAKFISITGSASITSLGTEPNVIKFVRAAAAAAFTLTHNATTLILPTSANITAAAGDSFIALSDASGNVRVMAYQRASGAALVSAAGDIAAGSVALFRQTSAPTGWTKDTTNYNDHAIRIVTGAASSGGTINLSTVFGYTATNSYTLAAADIPAHTHGPGTLDGFTSTNGSHTHGLNNATNVMRSPDSNDVNSNTGVNSYTEATITMDSAGSHSHGVTVDGGVTGSTGGGGGHTHAIDMRAKYVDAIWATKN